ncbi:MAG: Crp/Fnr family transcriptional regulator [Candidatus Marinimicrobia bacterium]|nr:Crp/Fnr family transcriptional regulator [Candidatus Neomarinimicrobiota bacterium]
MAEKTKLWYLENFNLFSGMAQQSMEEMNRKSKMKTNKKKEIIYFPDERSDTIYILKEGKVKISRIAEDGRTTTMQLIGPGEIFGEGSILGQEKHENIAEVVEDAVICTISKDMFQEMMKDNPALNLKITKFIGFRLQTIQAHVEDLVFKNAQERIESFLKRYVKNFGKQMVDGWMVRPFLKHQEIADITATARQTVNMVLNELAEQDTIKYTRRFLQVKNTSWLN